MANGVEETKAKSPWADLLSAAGRQLMPVLLTAGSLVGFVAFAGGVIVWTRFSAAKVPPDQAVNAVPRDELVAIGSSLLLLFGFFGVLALVGAFLIDRGARATPGMARALLGVFLIESATTVVIAQGYSPAKTLVAILLIALPVIAAFWASFSERYVTIVDDLPTREDVERPGPRGHRVFLLPDYPSSPWYPSSGHLRKPAWGIPALVRVSSLLLPFGRRLWSLGPVLFALVGIAGAVPLVAAGAPDTALLVWLGLALIVLVVAGIWRWHQEADEIQRLIESEKELTEEEEHEEAEQREAAEKQELSALNYAAMVERRGREAHDRDRERLLNDRPFRLVLRTPGAILIICLLAAAVGLPWAWLGPWWIGVSIAAAAALAVALWRISTLSAERVIWYGVAVFLSVPLFGTLTAMARNVEDPQVQPMALIRSSDGPDEAIQGLYVTEADERVYFATVATEGCTEDLTAHSGRLEWVPKSEVVAMSVGPLQDVDDASASALEMAYALTPAMESPAGTESSFTAGELEAADAVGDGSSRVAAKRLEGTGPAVRPFYGSGLSLTPENASPGDRVALTTNAPNEHEDVRGFGRTREGHTVRVGGVRATILKEYAHRADTAEFLETREGVLLRLEKGAPYKFEDGRFVRFGEDEFDPREEEGVFLKLVDPMVLEVGAQAMGSRRAGEGEAPGIYLRVERGESGNPVLAAPHQAVLLASPVDGTGDAGKPIETRFDPRPKAQAWHERQIRFVVPENASSGAVTVECSQLGGQPLLRVAHAPEARIAVRMEAGSSRVSFDAVRSSDADGERISRRWNIAGLRSGNRREITVDLPPRPRAYTVRMTATDRSGRTDVAEIKLLRLPPSLFEVDEHEPGNGSVLEEAREALEEAAAEQPPAAIEVAGHADDPGSYRHNVHLSLRRAERVRELLLREPEVGIDGGARVPVRTLAYGEECPADPGPGLNRRNRRVDVFVVDHGVSVEPPDGCRPRRLQSTVWELPATESQPSR